MPFTLIKGEFVPEAGFPDGDSIRFRPANQDFIFRLRQRGRPPKINQNNGTIQLRYEGIDTMEKRANPPISGQATKRNLELCGVPDGTGTAPGYILSNQLGPNGRPIAFVYAGETERADGSEVFLTADEMKESVNFAQVATGDAYPLFYDTLFSDLRNALAAEVQAAREERRGLWDSDASTDGAEWAGAGSLEAMPPFFPKLWRRLDTYSRDPDVNDPAKLDEFKEYLEFEKPERVFILSQARSTGLDNVVRVDGAKLSLLYVPDDLVVVSA